MKALSLLREKKLFVAKESLERKPEEKLRDAVEMQLRRVKMAVICKTFKMTTYTTNRLDRSNRLRMLMAILWVTPFTK